MRSTDDRKTGGCCLACCDDSTAVTATDMAVITLKPRISPSRQSAP
jgi:hypothetical protein